MRGRHPATPATPDGGTLTTAPPLFARGDSAELDECVVGALDVHEQPWSSLTDDQREAARSALQGCEVDPDITYRVDLLVLDGGALRIWQYEPGMNGRPTLNSESTGVARKTPFLVRCGLPRYMFWRALMAAGSA